MADTKLLQSNDNIEKQNRPADFRSTSNSSYQRQNTTSNLFTRIVRPVIAELIGTSMYLLPGLLTISQTRKVLPTALTFGISLAAYLACFGHISGGHFNPATTTAVFVAGEVHIVLAFMYIIIQMIGGITAAALAKLLIVPVAVGVTSDLDIVAAVSAVGDDIRPGSDGALHTTQNNGVPIFLHNLEHLQSSWWQAIVAEAVFTCTYTFVILMTTKDRMSKTGLAPFLVGLTLSICMIAIASVSGGHLNPIRSFGCAVISNNWKSHFVFWAGPLIGAVVAGLLYRFLFSSGQSRLSRKPSQSTSLP